jgi:hypothetical protein
MTTHEFDTYMDTQNWEPQDDSILLLEQERDFAEMEAAKESALKQQGAQEALSELRYYLMVCAVDERCRREFFGLAWAVDSIDRRLGELQQA